MLDVQHGKNLWAFEGASPTNDAQWIQIYLYQIAWKRLSWLFLLFAISLSMTYLKLINIKLLSFISKSISFVREAFYKSFILKLEFLAHPFRIIFNPTFSFNWTFVFLIRAATRVPKTLIFSILLPDELMNYITQFFKIKGCVLSVLIIFQAPNHNSFGWGEKISSWCP